MHKSRTYPFFIIALSILLLCIAFPLFSGKIPLAGRYLVQQFTPWVNDRRNGLETNLSHKPVGSDDLQLFYPNRLFTTASLLRGELPLWNPYILSGTPHIGQSETAVLYPLFFLTLLLPQYAAWTLLVLSEPVLSGIGMYLFLKRILRDSTASALGALAFGFSGVILVRMVEGLSVGHTLVWAPFVLWAVESFIALRKPKYLTLMLLFLSLSVFAGWLQYTFYIILLAVAYAGVRVYGIKGKEKLRMLFFVCLPFLLLPIAALGHILPAAEVFLASPRYLAAGTGEILIHLMPVSHLLAILVPDLWGNPGTYTFFGSSVYKESVIWIAAVPLIFSLVAILTNNKNKIVRFFCFVIAVTLILGINNPISSFIITSNIPLVSTFLPNRIFALTIISFSVLAGYGCMQVTQNPQVNKRTLLRVIMAVLLVLVVIAIAAAITYIRTPATVFRTLSKQAILGIKLRSLIIPFVCSFSLGIVTIVFLTKKTLTLFITLIFLISGFQQVSFARKYHEWSEIQYVYPTHPVISFLQKHAGFDRVIGIGGAHITSDISEVFGLYSAEGIAPNYPLQYAQFAQAALVDLSGVGNVGRVEVRIAPTQKNIFVEKNPALLKLLAISGTRYIVAWDGDEDRVPDDAIDSVLFRLVMRDGLWRIFEYTKALPRAFLTADFEVAAKADVLSRVFDAQTPAARIIVDESPHMQNDPNVAGTANIQKETANTVIVTTQSDKPMLLFISDTFWKDFRGFVDGKKTPILAADYTYRAIPVPQGAHTVIFTYDTCKERIAFAVAACVWLGVCGVLLWKKNDTI
jgi:hypothetical protein